MYVATRPCRGAPLQGCACQPPGCNHLPRTGGTVRAPCHPSTPSIATARSNARMAACWLFLMRLPMPLNRLPRARLCRACILQVPHDRQGARAPGLCVRPRPAGPGAARPRAHAGGLVRQGRRVHPDRGQLQHPARLHGYAGGPTRAGRRAFQVSFPVRSRTCLHARLALVALLAAAPMRCDAAPSLRPRVKGTAWWRCAAWCLVLGGPGHALNVLGGNAAWRVVC